MVSHLCIVAILQDAAKLMPNLDSISLIKTIFPGAKIEQNAYRHRCGCHFFSRLRQKRGARTSRCARCASGRCKRW
jgi:hypothetical protein